MDEKRYLCLYDIPIFSGIDKTKFPLICYTSKKDYKKKGEFLFRQGDIANAVYLIKEGSFKLVRITENGEEVIIQIVGQGEIIGEANLFREDIVLPISAIALEEAKVCSIDIQSLEESINNEPKIALHIIKNLGKRFYDTLEQIVELNTQTVQEKVLSLFIRLAQEYGEPCTEGTIIKICLTQEEIASIVGASRVMVSQTLKELIRMEYIYRKKKYYVLKGKCF
jgi:CRP/FNR family transcriptional regulator, cyclic AMP receptor protein